MLMPRSDRLKVRDEPGPLPTPCHFAVGVPGVTVREGKGGYCMLHFRAGPGTKTNVFRSAHIAHFWRARGPVPAGMVLDHLCGVRWCCNPDHLEPVTPAENVRRGACAKLNPQTVDEIKQLVSNGVSQENAGRRFGVSQAHVSRIVRGKYWADGPCPHWEERKRRMP